MSLIIQCHLSHFNAKTMYSSHQSQDKKVNVKMSLDQKSSPGCVACPFRHFLGMQTTSKQGLDLGKCFLGESGFFHASTWGRSRISGRGGGRLDMTELETSKTKYKCIVFLWKTWGMHPPCPLDLPLSSAGIQPVQPLGGLGLHP